MTEEYDNQYDYDDKIQLSILALLFRDSRFLNDSVQIIKPEFFDRDPYQYICRWTYEYHRKYKKAPAFETFTNYVEDKLGKLKRKSKTQKDEIRMAVEECFHIETPDPDYIRDCAVSFAKKQAFKEAVGESLELIEQDKLQEAISLVRRVERIDLDMSPPIDYFQKTVATVDDKDAWEKIQSGISGLDFLTGGIRRKQYGALCMVTGTGKTTSLLNLARSYARQGKNVIMFPNEQDEAELQAMLDCSILGISQKQRYKANNSKSKLRSIRKRVGVLQKEWGGRIFLKEMVYNEGRVSSMEAHIEKLEATEGINIDGIIVDSLDGLTSDYDNQWDNEVACFKEFGRLLSSRKKWGWTAVQVDIKNQGVREESKHIQRLGQLRGRADKVFLASLVVALNVTQPAEYKRGKFSVAKGFAVGLKTRNTYQGLRVPFRMDTNYCRLLCRRPAR